MVVAAGTVAVACTGPTSEPPTPITTEIPPLSDGGGGVTWISDGDTIDVETDEGTITVRLVAINAPDQGECYADEGLEHLIDTLKGRQVDLEVLGVDQFDRTLAHVFTSDRHVNLEMVELGLALASSPSDDDPYGDLILEAEETAFTDATGLWSSTACGHGADRPDVVFDAENSETDPSGPDDEVPDHEVVVIVNRANAIVNVGDWIIRDESTRHRFSFTSGTTIGPGESMAVSSADPGWDPGGSSVWNNSGDMALLQLPDGTVVDRWRYP